MEWTYKKVIGVIVLVALILAAVFYGEEGMDAVGSAVSAFFNFGGMEIAE